MSSGKWRSKIWYRKINIASFIFPNKNVQATGDSFYYEIKFPEITKTTNLKLLKLFLFDRDSYFWKAYFNVYI